jgi:hypothetical protein
MKTTFKLGRRTETTALALASRTFCWLSRIVGIAFIAVAVFLFASPTLLMTWGLFVFFFLTIGGFSLDGMMNHLQNLTSRYLAADAGRIDQFKLVVGGVHMVLSAAIIFFRRHAILPPKGSRVSRVPAESYGI